MLIEVQVFSVPTAEHARYQMRQVPYLFGKYVLRREMGPQEKLYHWEKREEKAGTTFAAKGEMYA